ncbi:MAG: hypothetical protein QW683_08420 [Candidatus Caldarchaeum sp.]
MRQYDFEASWSPVEEQMGALLREEPVGECLSLDELISIVEQPERVSHYRKAVRHLLRCHECKRAYYELKALRSPKPAPPRRWVFFSLWRTPMSWAASLAAVGILLVGLRLFVSQPINMPQQATQTEPATTPVAANFEPPTTESTPTPMIPYVSTQPRTQKPNTSHLSIEQDGRGVSNPTSAFRTRLAQELEAVSRQLPSRLHHAFLKASLARATQWSLLKPHATRGFSNVSAPPPLMLDGSLQVRIVHPQSVGTNLAVEPSRSLLMKVQQTTPTEEHTIVVRLEEVGTAQVFYEKTFTLTDEELQVEIPAEASSDRLYELTVESATQPNHAYARYRFRFLSQTPNEDGLSELQKLELAHHIKANAPLLAAQILYDIERESDALQILRQLYQEHPELTELDLWMRHLEVRQARLQTP